MFRYKFLQQVFQRANYRSSKHLRTLHTLPKDLFNISKEVAENLLTKEPVVALESTVITHGLPYPDNLKCALRLEEIVKQNNAVPATVGIINGNIHIGMNPEEIEKLAKEKENVCKVSRRDLPFVISKKLHGGTTVAATMILAYKSGISVFATGGIGGVHRGAEKTMDVSADLYELSRTPMTVISAGVKSILDIGLTLEVLESLGVCVATLGQSKKFPSFFTQDSEFSSCCNVETVSDAAQLINSRDSLNLDSGILLAVPIPDEYQEDGKEAHSVIEAALKEAWSKRITGKNITPFVLDQVHTLSKGASLRANIGLLENNARTGSQVAVALSKIKKGISRSLHTMMSPLKDEAKKVSSTSRPVVIGGSNLDIHVKVLEDIQLDGRTISGNVQSTAGGVGRNLADCMARLGCEPFFISLLGAQEYAKTLLSKMDHMDKGGIKILEDARTATCVVLLDNRGECVFVVGDMSIHDRLQPKQIEIHENMISTAPIVVIDGNIPPSTIKCIMNICTKHQIPVWFEPTDVSRVNQVLEGSAWRSAIAYASPNLNELRTMHDVILGKSTPPLKDDCLERKIEESLKLGIPLLNDTLHTLVVTLSSHGILLITRLPIDEPFPKDKCVPNKGKIQAIHYPAHVPDKIMSVSGAGDCFAAAMVSGILRGLNPASCVEAGQRAAILSLSSHHAVPYSICPQSVFRESTAEPLKNPKSVLCQKISYSFI